jgi:putative sigma-54 modulation protein
MQIHVTPRHLRLCASLHQAVAAQISTLEDEGADILGAHVVLLQEDTAKVSDRYLVKVHVSVRGPDLLAEQKGKDLYIALEQAVSKVRRQLRGRRAGAAAKKTRKAGNPQGGGHEDL